MSINIDKTLLKTSLDQNVTEVKDLFKIANVQLDPALIRWRHHNPITVDFTPSATEAYYLFWVDVSQIFGFTTRYFHTGLGGQKSFLGTIGNMMAANDEMTNMRSVAYALRSDLDAITLDSPDILFLKKHGWLNTTKPQVATIVDELAAGTSSKITITVPAGGAVLKSYHQDRQLTCIPLFTLSAVDLMAGDLSAGSYSGAASYDYGYEQTEVSLALPALASARITVNAGTKDAWKLQFFSSTNWTSGGAVLWFNSLPAWWSNGPV